MNKINGQAAAIRTPRQKTAKPKIRRGGQNIMLKSEITPEMLVAGAAEVEDVTDALMLQGVPASWIAERVFLAMALVAAQSKARRGKSSSRLRNGPARSGRRATD